MLWTWTVQLNLTVTRLIRVPHKQTGKTRTRENPSPWTRFPSCMWSRDEAKRAHLSGKKICPSRWTYLRVQIRTTFWCYIGDVTDVFQMFDSSWINDQVGSKGSLVTAEVRGLLDKQFTEGLGSFFNLWYWWQFYNVGDKSAIFLSPTLSP